MNFPVPCLLITPPDYAKSWMSKRLIAEQRLASPSPRKKLTTVLQKLGKVSLRAVLLMLKKRKTQLTTVTRRPKMTMEITVVKITVPKLLMRAKVTLMLMIGKMKILRSIMTISPQLKTKTRCSKILRFKVLTFMDLFKKIDTLVAKSSVKNSLKLRSAHS